jgi:hypothetical protein
MNEAVVARLPLFCSQRGQFSAGKIQAGIDFGLAVLMLVRYQPELHALMLINRVPGRFYLILHPHKAVVIPCLVLKC